jgi:hypothetical protein
MVRRVMSPARRALRRALLRFAALAALVAVGGCGGSGDAPGGRASSSPDTIRVDILGTRVVVPAPAGMVDAMQLFGRRPSRRGDGSVLESIFIPRDQVDAIREGAQPHDLNVFLTIPAVNAASAIVNANRFEQTRQKYLQLARVKRDPEAARIEEALEFLRAGAPRALDAPLAEHEGDTLVVAFVSPTPHVLETLALGRGRGGQRNVFAHHAAAYVLVRGRVVYLMWWQNGPFDLRTLDAVDRRVRDWAAAVLAANP